MKMNEDNANGRLNDECYELLSQNYEAKQKQLEVEDITLQHVIEVQEQQNESIEMFIQKAHKDIEIEFLDVYTLHELVTVI